MKCLAIFCLLLLAGGCKKGRTYVKSPPAALDVAIQQRDLAFVLATPPRHADLNTQRWPLSKPLEAAISSGQNDIVLALIQRGAEVKTLEDGSGPLGAAVYTEDPRLVELLLKHGSGVGRRGFGKFPIHQAARVGNVEIIKMLLAAGADPNTVSPTNGERPLDEAVDAGNEDTIRILLKAGASRDVQVYEPKSNHLIKKHNLRTDFRGFDQYKYLEEHPEFKPRQY